MEEQRKNEFPRPQETPDWAQETLAPAKPPFSASRKEVLLAFGLYVLAYVYLGSGWWALPLFAAGFIAAGEYLYRDMKRPWESWVWLACVIMIAGCITWRSLHPNQYDSRLDVQVMQEYAIPSRLAFLALHILAVYWLLCRSGRLTGGESGHLLPLDALYAFLVVPFQNFFLRIRCVIFALKSKKERGVSAGAIAVAVLAAFAALVLLVLAMTQLSAADDTFGELIDDLRLTLTLFLITVIVAGLLAFVNYLTADTIAEHTAEAARSAMTQVLAADDYTELPVSDAQAATGVTAAWSAGDAGTVVRLTTNGFGGAIDLMVGVDSENRVTGVAIISHSETASLGANCTREDFRAQFAGKTGELAVTKDGGDIDALTGATVTSRAVTRAVNAALAYAGEVQK